jgi:hypothetical protein
METVYMWLFILSGTTLVILGIFLFASDRHPKKQPRQAVGLRRNHQLPRARPSEIRSAVQGVTSDRVQQRFSFLSRLRAMERMIEKLLGGQRESALHFKQIADADSKLQAEIEALKQRLQSARDRLSSAEAENKQLRYEITCLKDQLQTSEARICESARQNQDTVERYGALQIELVELRRRTEESEATARKLREQLANAEYRERPPLLGSKEMAARRPENAKQIPLAARSASERKWRFGIIPATAATAILGAIAIGFVGTSSNDSFGSKEPVVAGTTGSDQTESRIQGASDTRQKPRPAAPAKVSEPSRPTPEAKSAPRLKGAFKTIHATELFTAPTEDSALIGTIARETQINVVDARGGWLEIRSEQPRRSGFIRQEAAVRIDKSKN